MGSKLNPKANLSQRLRVTQATAKQTLSEPAAVATGQTLTHPKLSLGPVATAPGSDRVRLDLAVLSAK